MAHPLLLVSCLEIALLQTGMETLELEDLPDEDLFRHKVPVWLNVKFSQVEIEERFSLYQNGLQFTKVPRFKIRGKGRFNARLMGLYNRLFKRDEKVWVCRYE